MTITDVTYSDRSENLRNPIAKVYGKEGISTDVVLRLEELAELRRLTAQSWLDVIAKTDPNLVEPLRAAGIENYHLRSHLLDHANIWTTHARTYTAPQADIIRSFSLFDFLDRELPPYRISGSMPPYGDLGRARINWRLVRPGDGTDLGPVHADYWFDAVLDRWSDVPGKFVRLKIWIAINLEEGLTGFAYSPGSHFEHYPYRRVRLPDGLFKPQLDESALKAPLKTVPVPCGTAVMFNYNLVHRGANTAKATQTRVSMELTLDIPRRAMEARYGDMSAFY